MAEHVVAALVAEGIEVIFTVPGEQHDPLFRALAPTNIRIVQTRHEQSAAYMAYGYARSTGKPAVFMVISGPGVLNSTAALATAYAANARVLCIAAEIPTHFIGRGIGVPHEVPEQLAILDNLTGWSARITDPADTEAYVGQAFHRLKHGRPRPVAIEIPTDVMESTVTERRPWTGGSTTNRTDPAAVVAAVRELAAARAPLVYVGSGATTAGPEIRELAERLQAPVVADVGGKGILDDRHPLSISQPVAHRLWRSIDVVLAVGTRLRRPFAEWGTEGLTIVRIDIDNDEMHRICAPAVPVLGDAATCMRALLANLPPVGDRAAWSDEICAARRDIGAELARLQPQVGFLQAMRDALPDDGILVDELTQVGYTARVAFPVLQPSTYISSTYFGALGFGFATALGVKIAHPQREVLSLSGDGGFLYTGNELASAVQHGIGVVAVVFNDSCYANVDRSQRRHMSAGLGTALHNPDFPLFAESFGAVGVRVNDADGLRTEIEKGFTRSHIPTLIEVPVGPMPNPWPFIRLPKVR
ncbi:thiamine pyrophosphate-dependent enzyme [Mycolicibacterium komossense]|uniref:acetolactate synthase n=1 Tax=Mycolicibacterium komossense TaxID=1779 RepID=A0ABT3C725_9MYCO|nr:thiamine pyrophosphate-dependent enzyme [Mycolicibacterium komossense]MCV7225261.1 hypothetical protein [Mycolicibacterium komossense]